jgi:hypothetical protein
VHSNRQELFDPQAIGFEFSIEQIELRAVDLQPDLFHDWACETDSLGSTVPQTRNPHQTVVSQGLKMNTDAPAGGKR